VKIDAAYVQANTPIVREQLQKAGVRLAHLLDASLGKLETSRAARSMNPRAVGADESRALPTGSVRGIFPDHGIS
jgi:hypothetical protein